MSQQDFDSLEYSVCQDCFMFIAYDEAPEEGMDRVHLSAAIQRELGGRQGHFSVGIEATEEDPEGAGYEEFSWSCCELCGSAQGGSRHGVTLFFTN